MRLMTTRISHGRDEDGIRQAYAVIELAEYEIRDLRIGKISLIERGCPFRVAREALEDIDVLDKALRAISLKRREEVNKP